MSREIDALVAEHVMGLVPDEYGHWWSPPNYKDLLPRDRKAQALPPYSTDIAAAWEVVEKLTPGGSFSMDRIAGSGNYGCGFYKGDGFDHGITFSADTAPMAICLAALKAKGINAEQVLALQELSDLGQEIEK